MIETEPEFDDQERDAWYGFWEYEAQKCPQCGQLRSVCGDPMALWYPQRHICYATADLSVHQRRWQKKHEHTPPDGAGRLPTDGVRIWVSPEDLTPDDRFL